MNSSRMSYFLLSYWSQIVPWYSSSLQQGFKLFHWHRKWCGFKCVLYSYLLYNVIEMRLISENLQDKVRWLRLLNLLLVIILTYVQFPHWLIILKSLYDLFSVVTLKSWMHNNINFIIHALRCPFFLWHIQNPFFTLFASCYEWKLFS